MMETIFLIQVTSGFSARYLKGKDCAGVPLEHQPGVNYYLMAGPKCDSPVLTPEMRSALAAKYPGCNLDRPVPESVIELINKTPKISGPHPQSEPYVVLTALKISVENPKSQIPKPKVDGGAGEPPQLIQLPEGWEEFGYPELQALAKQHAIAANQSKPDLIAALKAKAAVPV